MFKLHEMIICMAPTYSQSKALRVNISAKVKGSAGAVSTGLVWRNVNRINGFDILPSFVSALRIKMSIMELFDG